MPVRQAACTAGESSLSKELQRKTWHFFGKGAARPFEKIYVEDQGGMPGRRPPLIAPQITVFTFGRHTRVGTHSLAGGFLDARRKI